MSAKLLFRDKYLYQDGAIREMVIWRLKYRLYYGQSGHCLVRYDNERGKGDHRHYSNDGNEYEEPYSWVSVQQLMADFKADIVRLRGEESD